MSLRVRVSPESEVDLFESYAWYEEAQPGLGTLFLDSVETALNYVAQDPLAAERCTTRSGECSLTDFRTGSPIRSRKMPSLSLDASTCDAIPQCGGPVPRGRRTISMRWLDLLYARMERTGNLTRFVGRIYIALH